MVGVQNCTFSLSHITPHTCTITTIIPHTLHYHYYAEEEEGEGELVATIRPEPIMQLRDPYSERLFPSIIGTQDFYQSERLGLVEYISDGEECMYLYDQQGNSTMYSIPSPTSSSL